MKVMPLSHCLFAVATIAIGFGCAESEPISAPIIDVSGSAGSGPGGAAGRNGTTGTAGTTAATSGTQGTLGGARGTGTAGATGSAGVTGNAGITGSAGITGDAGILGDAAPADGGGSGGRGAIGGSGARGGTTGSAGSRSDGGAPEAGIGADGGTAPTFTTVYSTILVVYCGGSSCHNPGAPKGLGFASRTTAYTGLLKGQVSAGNSAGSGLYKDVNNGSMPRGNPKLSAANIALIKAWIDAGALDN